jgi:hypothetical protein
MMKMLIKGRVESLKIGKFTELLRKVEKKSHLEFAGRQYAYAIKVA